jgi:hypothetical protein
VGHLRRVKSEVYELDSHTLNEQSWLGSGCLLMALGGTLGLSGLVAGVEGPMGWLMLGCLTMFTLGMFVTCLAFLLHESYLLGAGGVRLRRSWLGFTRQIWLARSDQIHGLALDGSERGPRSWRLMLVCNDGQTHQLAGYSYQETEDQRWQEMSALATEVATALAVSVRLPEGIERDRRLQVFPGQPPTVEYTELLELTNSEVRSILKSIVVLLFLFLAILGLAFWLRCQG